MQNYRALSQLLNTECHRLITVFVVQRHKSAQAVSRHDLSALMALLHNRNSFLKVNRNPSIQASLVLKAYCHSRYGWSPGEVEFDSKQERLVLCGLC